MTQKTKKRRRVQLCIQYGEELRFYDLPSSEMSGENFERVLAAATQAFAQSFDNAARGISLRVRVWSFFVAKTRCFNGTFAVARRSLYGACAVARRSLYGCFTVNLR